MLLDTSSVSEIPALLDLIAALPQVDDALSFGPDIDATNRVLLDDSLDVEVKLNHFLKWSVKHQPCLFGRLGALGARNIGIDICWVDEADIRKGDSFVQHKLQKARRMWKDRAADGLAHGFLIFFNSRRLCYARPSMELVALCKRIGDLYLPESAPVETDVIYTEAIPLKQRDEDYRLFKAGINIFYSSAHRTRNHDRRIPGGLMISINSPGHYANSLVQRGFAGSFKEAVKQVQDIAWRSIGNGGIGSPGVSSASWHNVDDSRPVGQCPMRSRPNYIPENFSTRMYSALYHTDVLIPTDVTVDNRDISSVEAPEVWSWLIFDYITESEFPPDHVNYGLFHGHPITPEAKYYNPWPPRRAFNAPLANY